MVAWDQVKHADILRAISECDRLGQDRFLSEYGFAPAKWYVLTYNGHRYDSKAILGVAYQLATSQGLGSGDFEGGRSGAVAVLRKLGFVVDDVREHAEDASREPRSVPQQGGPGAGRSVGARILDDFRARASRDGIARCLADYAAVTGYDASLRRLRRATSDGVDLESEAHRTAVADWLRAWGCRHLRRADARRTTAALGSWWEAWGGKAPRPASLAGLGVPELLVVEHAYDALRKAPAAGRSLRDHEIDVAFGHTAAAKVMYAVRPDVSCRGIVRSGRHSGGAAAGPPTLSYCSFLAQPCRGWPSGWRCPSTPCQRSWAGRTPLRRNWSTNSSGSR